MADVITDNTTIGNTKQALIAALVQKELAFQAVLTGFFTDVSVYAVPGAKTIDFPKANSFVVTNRAEGAKGEAQALSTTLDQLALDQNAYVSWIVDAMTLKQSNIPAQTTSAKRAASAQARYVDTQIIARLASIASFFVNVGADVDITYDNTVDMAQKIEEAHQLMEDCIWLISPKQKAVMRKMTEFKDNTLYPGDVIMKGQIGYLHGARVVVHSGLAAKQVFLAHKDAVVFGFQSEAAYGEQGAIEYGVGAVRAAVDQLFGTGGQQLGAGGAAAGKSPLVIGLND